jgi:hypothetical protein
VARKSRGLRGLEAAGYRRADWSADRRAQWLLEFARFDFSAGRRRELAKLLDGWAGFLWSTYVAQTTGLLSTSRAGRRVNIKRPPRMILTSGSLPMPSMKALAQWQQWLRRGLEILGRSDIRFWHIKPRGLSYSLQRLGSGLVAQSVLHRADTTEWFKDFTYQTLVEARNLRFCETCGDAFIRIRRQAYCSPRCSQKVRTARHRFHHRNDINERRRRAYEKKQREKLGPKRESWSSGES